MSTFDKTHRHSYGPAVADDGTPAGYPQDDTDHDLTVVRFDDVTDPANPRPLANLVNFSLHPEFLNGNDLISADFVAPLQRMVDRATGGLTVFTQNAVGTAEPERSSYHSMHERLEFTHREYAQAEYGARLMADSITDTWRDVERVTPERPDRFVPFDDSLEVAMEDRWFPGPLSHPYPGVSNCRADKAFEGDPQFPVVGLPTCENAVGVLQSIASIFGLPRPPDPPSVPIDPGISTDDFQSRGIPLPENYSAPSYTGLAEDVSVHLQAFRLGDILFTVCSCEQWKDQSYDIKTRTDTIEGNQYIGYDWASRCAYDGDTTGTWTCPDPRNPSTTLPPIPSQKFLRMKAQVNNDAVGWNDLSNLLWAESEPTDTTQIKGNYTHDELPSELGYRLTVPISMANDYNGYIASYREYQSGDHYRKALTAWGPHSSDYLSSRLVAMGGRLNGGPELPTEAGQAKVTADVALNDQRADKLGQIGDTSVRAYEASLPDDGGTARALEQPRDVQRFAAAFFKWNGGSNFTDNPRVEVQSLEGGVWTQYAGQAGEMPVTLEFPEGQDAQSYLEGGHEWHWTAHFEAFAANFDTIEGSAGDPRRHLPLRGRWPPPPGRAAGPLPPRVGAVPRRAMGRHHRRGPAFRAGRAHQLHGRPAPQADRQLGRAVDPGRTRADRLPRQLPLSGQVHRRRPAGVPRPGGALGPGAARVVLLRVLVPALGRHRPPRPRVADRGPRGRHAGAVAGPAARRSVHREPSPQAGGTRLCGGRRPDRRLRKRERTAVVRPQGPRLSEPRAAFPGVFGLPRQGHPSENGTKAVSPPETPLEVVHGRSHRTRRGAACPRRAQRSHRSRAEGRRPPAGVRGGHEQRDPRAAAAHRVRSPSTCGRPRRWCGWRSPTAGPASWQPSSRPAASARDGA